MHTPVIGRCRPKVIHIRSGVAAFAPNCPELPKMPCNKPTSASTGAGCKSPETDGECRNRNGVLFPEVRVPWRPRLWPRLRQDVADAGPTVGRYSMSAKSTPKRSCKLPTAPAMTPTTPEPVLVSSLPGAASLGPCAAKRTASVTEAPSGAGRLIRASGGWRWAPQRVYASEGALPRPLRETSLAHRGARARARVRARDGCRRHRPACRTSWRTAPEMRVCRWRRASRRRANLLTEGTLRKAHPASGATTVGGAARGHRRLHRQSSICCATRGRRAIQRRRGRVASARTMCPIQPQARAQARPTNLCSCDEPRKAAAARLRQW